jgi:hypothetical protein
MAIDLSNDEIEALYKEVGGDVIKFARTIIAKIGQHEYHSGIVPSTSAEQYQDIHLRAVK